VKRAFYFALALTTSLLLARVHPFGNAGLYTAKPTPQQLLEHTSIPPAPRAILTAKCIDCHSTQTTTPIYGRFAPISWLMERDILAGRAAMNLSQWDTYSTDQQQTFAAKIVQKTKAHDMPLLQYRIIHWNARITDSDVQIFTQWAHETSTPAEGLTAQITGEGDPTRGQQVFEKRCTGCHSITQDREGPRLQGVYGRTSGQVAGFPYSEALKKSHTTWNDASLERWLADPDAFLPGNNMDFLVPKPQERKDLIAYFKQNANK
jgi:cytochrome c